MRKGNDNLVKELKKDKKGIDEKVNKKYGEWIYGSKGITLISLVVTIVVVLILAGITIEVVVRK